MTSLFSAGQISVFRITKRKINSYLRKIGPEGLIKKFLFYEARMFMTIVSPLFVQLMHINYYKIVKQLKSFKIIIVAPTCFALHKPSSASSQPVLRLKDLVKL